MTIQEMANLCESEAAKRVNAIKEQYPNCEGAMNLESTNWTLLGEDGYSYLMTNPGNIVSSVSICSNGRFFANNSRIYCGNTVPGNTNIHATGMMIGLNLATNPTESIQVTIYSTMGTFARGNNSGGVDCRNATGYMTVTLQPGSANPLYCYAICDCQLPA